MDINTQQAVVETVIFMGVLLILASVISIVLVVVFLI